MSGQPHSQAILEVLADRLSARRAAEIRTPFGTCLHATQGRYAVGDSVLAPGVDECSPREPAQVLACGTRPDHKGLWYLLRFAAGCGLALVEEADLRALPGCARMGYGAWWPAAAGAAAGHLSH